MPLTPGTQLGPYEISAALGAGGMGEVYRARDKRLERTVAVKVLPAEVSANAERKQRFEREARTISSLNHPNICALYDVGSQDGIEYLVLEFVEGETLEKRLEKGPLPTDALLRHGMEIADALEKAHRSGVIHRDLKPANIMLTKSGAKLLDFGLAKWSAAGASEEETLKTLTTGGAKLTEQGTILGTFQYMAPEQLEGKEADARTDLFAFGEVLYEMATGRAAFAGKTKASLIAAILSAEPTPISTVQPMTPPALDRLVRGCLAKDADERWQTAHDVKLQLRAIAEGGSQQGVPAPVVAQRKNRERVAWAAAGLLGIFAVALAIGYIARTPAPAAVIVSQIVAPENGQFVFYGVFGGAPALSPDGKRMVFTGQGKDGRMLLWMRSLNAATAQPLAGTEQGVFPFWSPDSRYVGYFANGKLNRIDVSGGPPFSLCDAGTGRGGTWSRDGTILFSPDTLNSPLFRVAASGGVAFPVTKLNPAQNEIAHRWPQFLPDGKHFLFFDFTTTGTTDGTYVGALDGAPPKLLLRGNVSAIYSPQGYLLYLQNDTLMAQKFDPATLQLTGDAVPLAEQVSSNRALRQETVSVSDNGLLVYGRGHGTSINQLQWLDRSGKEIAQIVGAGDYGGPRISPDGKNLAASLRVAGETGQSIWVYDLAHGNGARRTFERMSSISPSWSPDGKTLVFASIGSGVWHLYQKAADGTGDTTALIAEAGFAENYPFWSLDGRYLLFSRVGGQAKSTYSIWALPLFGDRKAFKVLEGSAFLDHPALSPDGKWLAYRSAESGLPQVYVAPFPTGNGKWQVSTSGGVFPRWRRDGRELFYLSLDSKLMTTEVAEQKSSLSIGEVKPLFQANIMPFGQSPGYPYDVTADGAKFVVVRNVTPLEAVPMTLVSNWPALLKKEQQ